MRSYFACDVLARHLDVPLRDEVEVSLRLEHRHQSWMVLDGELERVNRFFHRLHARSRGRHAVLERRDEVLGRLRHVRLGEVGCVELTRWRILGVGRLPWHQHYGV